MLYSGQRRGQGTVNNSLFNSYMFAKHGVENFHSKVFQAHGDLVSAVDFSEEYLVTGYEDSNVGVWSMETGLQVNSV